MKATQLAKTSSVSELSHLPISGRARIAVTLAQLTHGGAERQTVELLRRLRGTEWEPAVVICLSEDLEPYGPIIRDLGYRLQVLPRTSSFDLTRVLKLRRMLHQEQIDLVHAVQLRASAYSWLACQGREKPRVLPTVRATLRRLGIIRWCIYRLMLKRSPHTLVNSYRGARAGRTFRDSSGASVYYPERV